tara:strand:- start:8175 stop:8621 length:447 start_codon:yes stop_codon:yes gene_type:complete
MKNYMDEALTKAKDAYTQGEVPVGCVIVERASGRILAKTANRSECDHDPTAHAEVLAIRAACAALGDTRLPGCDMYVTLEPCTMCAAAISFARIQNLYFGAYDPKGGGVDHGARFYQQPTCHHKPDVYGGINEQECQALLKTFFQERR